MIARQMPEYFDEYHIVDGRKVKIAVRTDHFRASNGYPHRAVQSWHATVAQAVADTEALKEQDEEYDLFRSRVDAKFNRTTRNSELHG